MDKYIEPAKQLQIASIREVNMPDIEECCGTCTYWQPGRKRETGSLTYTTEQAHCKLFTTGIRHTIIKYAEDKPESWCWKRASEAQLASRIKAGLINNEGSE